MRSSIRKVVVGLGQRMLEHVAITVQNHTCDEDEGVYSCLMRLHFSY